MQAIDLNTDGSFDQLLQAHVDINNAAGVDVSVVGDTMWLNVNGVCLVRLTDCKHITLNSEKVGGAE